MLVEICRLSQVAVITGVAYALANMVYAFEEGIIALFSLEGVRVEIPFAIVIVTGTIYSFYDWEELYGNTRKNFENSTTKRDLQTIKKYVS